MTTVLPRSLSLFITDIRRSVSRGCKPILGSSRMYIDPTRLLPNELTRLILWLSPPLNVFDLLLNVK